MYLVISAFLPPPRVHEIFDGFDMLSDPGLCGVFLSLVGGGNGGTKPYECIGTFAESSAAVELTVHQWKMHHLNSGANFTSAESSSVLLSEPALPVVLEAMARHVGVADRSADCPDRRWEPEEVIRKWTQRDSDQAAAIPMPLAASEKCESSTAET